MLLQYKDNLQKTQQKLKKNSERKARMDRDQEVIKMTISAEERLGYILNNPYTRITFDDRLFATNLLVAFLQGWIHYHCTINFFLHLRLLKQFLFKILFKVKHHVLLGFFE